MNYTIYKVGDDWQKLLNKVFQEDAKIKDSVFFIKTLRKNLLLMKTKENLADIHFMQIGMII
jgi:hypothetical protein